MSVWSDQNLDDKVVEALATVPVGSETEHHFGRPWITTYQLAIKIDAQHPEIATALGVDVGGLGTGRQVSLAQYLAKQLSARIKQGGEHYPIEGAFLSGTSLTELSFVSQDGHEIKSSMTNSGFDLSLFPPSLTMAPNQGYLLSPCPGSALLHHSPA
ncbi:hypothetical protein EV643_1341 [Kribbella sp. VKM Ac-2527]|uniref:Uncharacterized protein n=1 Tax=Kribbella caucasensis TaxID=2512215 RepID=A0A4R6J775_9ACTN|nr:hypothetical protein [Kribbella sp. VKM Ac-2527]TDO30977.1 hypothetical protein EV643_1341 [Kribbella sp. VKM Ac-2527]